MPQPLKVLMVEDSKDDALLLAEELRAGGYEPIYTRVDTADAMRRALEAEPWEIVLADYYMPHFSGPEALRVLRESRLDIPYIVVSGTVTEQQAIDMMRDGASDFILKQRLGRLVPAIRRELREAQVRQERRHAQEALQREQAFLSSAIELLPFPIIFNTPNGEVIRANQASYRFFEDLGTSAWWNRQLLTADTRTPIPHEEWPMARAARGEVVPQTEGILVLPNGREVPVLAVAAPVFVGEQLVATVVAFMDISPLKEADRAKNQFLAVLSHELRTPLANILGWTREAQEMPTEVPEALRIIQRNAGEQQRMLENLLEVSRLLHGKLTLRQEPADLWQLMLDMVAEMTPIAGERNIHFVLHPPDGPLPVSVDQKRVRIVLCDLLDNAVRCSKTGQQVAVYGYREDAMAVLCILDTGKGIPPEVLPHLFDLFYISPEVEQTGGGLGLGLPLSKAIVERHGGKISVTSAGVGQGETATVTLPLANGEGEAG